jgi:hypothetical protein
MPQRASVALLIQILAGYHCFDGQAEVWFPCRKPSFYRPLYDWLMTLSGFRISNSKVSLSPSSDLPLSFVHPFWQILLLSF